MFDPTKPVDPVDLALDEIQGNILEGFNNDHQRFLFFRIDDASKAKSWLQTLLPRVSTTTQVKKSNDTFRAAGRPTPSPMKASWINIAFNFPGLEKLGVPLAHTFPEAFKEGMAKRNRILGDVGQNSPDQWDPSFSDRAFLNIILILSADEPADLAKLIASIDLSLPNSGLSLIHTQAGENTPDLHGNEHFGFKDGISQPGVKGFTLSSDPKNPSQGLPGQDLLWPGEFVLGYPTQDKRRDPAFDGPNQTAGLDSTSGPTWTENGSYLVFRKLGQDVAGFRNSIRTNAAALGGMDPEVLGAKIVGRFRSGCPMEQLKAGAPQVDTNKGDPTLNGHPEFITDDFKVLFEYGGKKGDKEGYYLPRSGHIRKAYPRDEQLLKADGNEDEDQTFLHESDTQTHRILRRGIPFGPAILIQKLNGLSIPVNDDRISRGLLFLCYQSDLERQFEFIQTKWINDPTFPQPGDGADPVMSQVRLAPMKCPFGTKDAPPTTFDLKHFVTTNGGEYFFQPSISALTQLSA